MEENKYLKTGFKNYDIKLSGLKKGNVVLLGGRPSMGKTAFAVSLTDNVCQRNEGKCIYFSADVEIPVPKLFSRFVSVRKGALALGGVSDENIAINEINNYNLALIDDYNESTDYKLERLIREVEKEPVALIIIDGLQMLCADGSGYMDESKIQTVLKTFKAIAVNVNCPVLITSDLARTADTRKDHHPDIKDICGVVNPLDDIDDILFLIREEYYDIKAPQKDVAEITHFSVNSDKVTKVELHLIHEYAFFHSK